MTQQMVSRLRRSQSDAALDHGSRRRESRPSSGSLKTQVSQIELMPVGAHASLLSSARSPEHLAMMVAQLQRTYGNRYVTGLIAQSRIQRQGEDEDGGARTKPMPDAEGATESARTLPARETQIGQAVEWLQKNYDAVADVLKESHEYIGRVAQWTTGMPLFGDIIGAVAYWTPVLPEIKRRISAQIRNPELRNTLASWWTAGAAESDKRELKSADRTAREKKDAANAASQGKAQDVGIGARRRFSGRFYGLLNAVANLVLRTSRVAGGAFTALVEGAAGRAQELSKLAAAAEKAGRDGGHISDDSSKAHGVPEQRNSLGAVLRSRVQEKT